MKKIKLVICLFSFTGYLHSFGQSNINSLTGLSMETITAKGPEYDRIMPLAGKWNVEMKIWNDSSDKPVMIGNYVAERTMQQHFLEEVMQPAKDAKDKPFKRIIYLNYNYANERWEYIVLDTRYPVMMFETSTEKESNNKEIHLFLPSFVMPPGWIDKNGGQLTRQRRIIKFINDDETIMQQYWTVPGGKEFLAVQYKYMRMK